MSYGAADGMMHVSCSADCGSRQHVLIIRDCEQVPYAMQLTIGEHVEVVEAIQPLLPKYFELVDDESAFFLQPLAIELVDIVQGELLKEISVAEEMIAEEEANLSGK